MRKYNKCLHTLQPKWTNVNILSTSNLFFKIHNKSYRLSWNPLWSPCKLHFPVYFPRGGHHCELRMHPSAISTGSPSITYDIVCPLTIVYTSYCIILQLNFALLYAYLGFSGGLLWIFWETFCPPSSQQGEAAAFSGKEAGLQPGRSLAPSQSTNPPPCKS